MAAAHLESVHTVQPEGPYLLGGFCNGGLVAYEMARQLHARGEMVDLIILMNPTPVGQCRLRRRIVNRLGKLLRMNQEKQLYCYLWLWHLHSYVEHVYSYLRFPSYRKLKTELDRKGMNQDGMVIITLRDAHWLQLHAGSEGWGSDEQRKPERKGNWAAFRLARLNDLFPEALFPTVAALRRDWVALYYWSASEYEPSFYPGKSTFFFTQDKQEHGEDVEWLKIAEAKDQEVEVYTIAGTHDTCRKKYLHDLTEHLGRCLSYR